MIAGEPGGGEAEPEPPADLPLDSPAHPPGIKLSLIMLAFGLCAVIGFVFDFGRVLVLGSSAAFFVSGIAVIVQCRQAVTIRRLLSPSTAPQPLQPAATAASAVFYLLVIFPLVAYQFVQCGSLETRRQQRERREARAALLTRASEMAAQGADVQAALEQTLAGMLDLFEESYRNPTCLYPLRHVA